eukprot:TRINITY_DN11035_c0_g1::TRINITY_DN11035_c0_g1_i1::g.18155::m.18155 TRINITY_DN11035_c0_g1::TRINITY_DN11035_c0_g1_i1::g.18155  ORF type:complete len:160 (+),score=26.48,sp/Q9D0B6/PBDC1_MOUSE/52.76/1e-45,Polysacc_synt_4/PF04669.8/1.7e-20,Aromatic_hydrox/PF11723.3/0.083 TRINITY_DN11035_c0_g1_i1:49-528(+)
MSSEIAPVDPLMGDQPVPQPSDIEHAWAVRAFKHADTYWNLLTRIDPMKLKLTKLDDDLYADFRKEFPDFRVQKITEDDLKAEESKNTWRPFLMKYEKEVQDYNMLTLLRLDASMPYSETNTTVVPRVQFYAIEIARNREGFNSKLATPSHISQPGFKG